MVGCNKVCPEEEGIPSLWLSNMMDRWEKQLCHVHGYVILKDGKLVAEAYKYPYTKESRRLLNSVSKTITAIAAGMAIEEGYISVDDKVLSFFPEYKPQPDCGKFLSELTIAHLLTMSTGHGTDSIDSIYVTGGSAWKSFLDTEMVDRPGSRFVYNSGATYMLSKILTITTGEKILDYLTPRLFIPLEIVDASWDEIDGANTGGWGCLLSLPDMIKIGELLLQKGKWNGKQLIPEHWVEEMSGWKIASDETNVYPDWQKGYCYQMWRCSREGCYRADGAFGQYILILPPKNMVMAIWSEDAFSQDMLDSFWEEVYDKIDNRIYGIDGHAQEIFHKKCIEWSAPWKFDPSYSYQENRIDGKKYRSVQEKALVDSMCFCFSGCGQLELSLIKDGVESKICADNTCLQFDKDKMNFEIASFIRLGAKAEEDMSYGAVYQWISDHVLKIRICWLETSHATEITCTFGADQVAAVFSVSYGKLLMQMGSTPAVLNEDQWFMGRF